MRKVALLLAVACLLLPFNSSAHALKLVEGDKGWDCETMGNRSCRADVSSLVGLIEGQPGWDCRTMGNATCGNTSDLASFLAYPALTGTTERVNVSSSEEQANAGGSEDVDISRTGRFVAFRSTATNLVAGDTNTAADVFVRDRLQGTTERVSVSDSEGQADGSSFQPSISADGRFVAFASDATNLAGSDANGASDVFVRDRELGKTERISVGLLGEESDAVFDGTEDSVQPDISADGRFVAFASRASNLAVDEIAFDEAAPVLFPAAQNVDRSLYEEDDFFDVFVRDRLLQATERVSVNPVGLEATGPPLIPEALPDSIEPAISDDGRTVAFLSVASNFELDAAVSLMPPGLSIYPEDNNGTLDVFVRDRLLRTTERITPVGGITSLLLGISSNGRFVTFSSAQDFTAQPCGVCVYVHDRSNGTKEQIEGNGSSISDNGSRVAFTSPVAYVPEDTSSQQDAYLWDRPAGTQALQSLSTGGAQANAQSFSRALSGDGLVVAFTSDATNLVDGDTNGVRDLFVRVN